MCRASAGKNAEARRRPSHMSKRKNIISSREHARYPCSIPVRAHAMRTFNNFDAEILDIGMSGVHIRTAAELGMVLVRLEFSFEQETLKIEVQVVHKRKDPKTPKIFRYGALFRPNRASGPKIRKLVDRIRPNIKYGPDLRADYWGV